MTATVLKSYYHLTVMYASHFYTNYPYYPIYIKAYWPLCTLSPALPTIPIPLEQGTLQLRLALYAFRTLMTATALKSQQHNYQYVSKNTASFIYNLSILLPNYQYVSKYTVLFIHHALLTIHNHQYVSKNTAFNNNTNINIPNSQYVSKNTAYF